MFWVLRTLRYRGRSRGQLRKYGKWAPARDSVSGLWSRSKPLDNPMMWSRRSRETELSSRNASIPQTVSVRQSQERRFRFIRPTFRASLSASKTAGPRIRSPAAAGRASHTASGKNLGSSPLKRACRVQRQSLWYPADQSVPPQNIHKRAVENTHLARMLRMRSSMMPRSWGFVFIRLSTFLIV